MIAFRGIQGIGGGMLMSITLTAIGDLYPPEERAKWTCTMMAIFGLSSILGPVLGGVLADYISWKWLFWLFWLFLHIGVIAFVMILKLFPKKEGDSKESIDYLGSIFLGLTITGLILGFSWAGSKYAWGSPQIIGLFTATFMCILMLIFVERKAKFPIMPLSLFKNKGVTISNIASFLMSGGMMGAMSPGLGPDFTKLDSATAENLNAMANPQLLLDKSKLEAVQASLPDQVQQIFLNMMDMVRTAMGQALSWLFFIGAFL